MTASTSAPSSATAESSEPSPTRVREQGGFLVREFRFRGGHQLPRHEHPEPMLVLMTGGAYRGGVRRDEYVLEPGEGLVAPPARDHRGTVGGTGSSALIVSWTGSRLDDARHAGLDRLRRLTGREHGSLTRRIRREFSLTDAVAAIALESALLDLLAAIGRSTAVSSGHAPPRWIAQTRELLDADLANPPSVNVIAATIGVSRSHLNRAFRQALGMSIGHYIRERRMEIAAARLRHTRLSIARIGLDLGFADQSHFTRTFAAAMGTSPGRYRRAAT